MSVKPTCFVDAESDDADFILGFFGDHRLSFEEFREGYSIRHGGSFRLERKYDLYDITDGVLGRARISGPILFCIGCRKPMERSGFNKGTQFFKCIYCSFYYSRPLRVIKGRILFNRNQGRNHTPFYKPRSQMASFELREYNRIKKQKSRARLTDLIHSQKLVSRKKELKGILGVTV